MNADSSTSCMFERRDEERGGLLARIRGAADSEDDHQHQGNVSRQSTQPPAGAAHAAPISAERLERTRQINREAQARYRNRLKVALSPLLIEQATCTLSECESTGSAAYPSASATSQKHRIQCLIFGEQIALSCATFFLVT